MVSIVLHRAFFKDHIAFDLPRDTGLREALRRELRKCRDRHNDYVLVTIQPPKRARTTGANSQNHHLNGHIMQICSETGQDYEEIKYIVKMKAVELMGYPYKLLEGHIFPKPEHKSTTDECAKLIEAAHVLAAEFGIILQE